MGQAEIKHCNWMSGAVTANWRDIKLFQGSQKLTKYIRRKYTSLSSRKESQALLTPRSVLLPLYHFTGHRYYPINFFFFEIGTMGPKRKHLIHKDFKYSSGSSFLLLYILKLNFKKQLLPRSTDCPTVLLSSHKALLNTYL